MDTRSQPISKRMVWEAYKKVKANRGSAGIDKVSLQDYEASLSKNLYKLWNRLSSGSYFPPPVKEVGIPKRDGKKRKLGIPTVGDRIAQMVAKDRLEEQLDKLFDPSSYGYRKNKSAHEAIISCRQNCWHYDWVIDMDIKGFFDNISHDLMMKALMKHTKEKWVLIYVERWLKAPICGKMGTLNQREKGTPQGGVISPLLANLYLHYAFDKWMRINHPEIRFERYADDVVVHCSSYEESARIKLQIKERLATCKLTLHEEKTKIVYCKKSGRDIKYPLVSFDFLGYEFKPRRTIDRTGRIFTGFNPGMSAKSRRRINDVLKRMSLHTWSTIGIERMAEILNPKIRGWINYYGKFRKSDMDYLWSSLNLRLIKWARRKYKRFKGSTRQAADWLRRVYMMNQDLFAHWQFVSP
ncbi:group II intron reverse transcriptase/maturase [Candidatus Bathyarchaeota archaeon]|nr:group II intron reverse transcriptase/maturase [Candidatus Bathyarchaeota archaeon]